MAVEHVKPVEHVHFVGIGGAGMSAIAGVLLQKGVHVSGSDLVASEATEQLAHLGATIYIGHAADHVASAERLVISTAITEDNVELVAAQHAGIPIWHRSEMLAQLLNERDGVAVAGTHGKTTVTSMLAWICDRVKLDPTFLIGGYVPGLGAARCGHSPYLIAEADESDRSFLRYRPAVAVITNVEPDHLEHYGGSFEQLVDTFRGFLLNLKPGGTAVLGTDDPEAAKLAYVAAEARGAAHVRTFGIESGDWRALDIQLDHEASRFRVERKGHRLGWVHLHVPGRHNVQNALAALAAADVLGVDFARAAEALGSFRGAKRRFQLLGEAGGVTVIDDYAHNPSKVKATLRAAQEGWDKRIVAVFQPHRYVRTKFLMNDFAASFGEADVIVLTEVYAPPPDAPIPGVNGRRLFELVCEHENRLVTYCPTLDDVLNHLIDSVRPGDMVITMGAGNIYLVGQRLLTYLRAQSEAKQGA